MGLIPKNQYRGQITGERKATGAELHKYGKTTFAKTAVKKFKNTGNGPIHINVKFEKYLNQTKKWIQTYNNDWTFATLKNAADYISEYMKSKGAKPNNKNGKEYYFTRNGKYIDVTVEQLHNGEYESAEVKKYIPNSTAPWDNGVTLYSQWFIKKDYTKVTFEQIKEVTSTKQRDYHDPLPSPWSHKDINTSTYDGKTNKRLVRTYLGADAQDTTQQRNASYRREKWAINKEYKNEVREALEKQYGMTIHVKQSGPKREYDDSPRTKLGMNVQQYRQFQEDKKNLNKFEFEAKYGRKLRYLK